MNFLSVKEFFYKVNTIGFILLLFPIIVFLYIHIYAMKSFPIMMEVTKHNMLFIFLTTVVAAILTVVNLIWRSRIRHMRSYLELSKKMEGFFVLFVIRNSVYAVCLLLTGGGYYLTHSIYFTCAFMLILVVLLVQWPGPKRFCRVFELKGSERDLVLHNWDLVAKRKPKKG